jgi:putative peptidoglycan lipid II flippase
MKDARTPTLIQLVMVAVRTPLLLLVPVLVADEHVVAGLMLVTSLTYVVGWIAGQVALARTLGIRGNGEAIGTVVRMTAVSLVAGLLGWGAARATESVAGDSLPGSLATVVIGTVVIGVAVLAGAVVAGVPEVRGAWVGVRARLGRPRSS